MQQLLIQARPYRVEGAQPIEQLGIRCGRIRAGQCLIEVMMRIHQARNRDDILAKDAPVSLGEAGIRRQHLPDLPAFYEEVRPFQDCMLRIVDNQRVNVANQERTEAHSGISSCSRRISSRSAPSAGNSNGLPAAERAERTSFNPFPVISATALARCPMMPSSIARRNPATAAAAAGSAKIPVNRPVYRIASTISASE